MRKEMDFTVPDEPMYSRDKGKVFHLTEMAATPAEKWALRVFLAVTASGVDIGPVFSGGMAGIAGASIQSLPKIDPDIAEPLLDTLMSCVKIKPDPRNPAVTRYLVEDDIEEVATRLRLKKEVFELHVGFLQAVAQSNSGSAAKTMEPISSNTSMSPQQSEPAFHQAKRRPQNLGQR